MVGAAQRRFAMRYDQARRVAMIEYPLPQRTLGLSTEATFPETGGPDLDHNGGDWDAFVAKVKADGTVLAYCGYIGGSGNDRGYGIAVDAAGSAYVTGDTYSTEETFPVIGGPDLTYNDGDYDAFVARVMKNARLYLPLVLRQYP